MSEPTVEVRGLTVQRGKRTVLEVPALAANEGEVLAVIGPNGAGKSTLLQALALLLPATMTYRFLGRQVALPREALALRRQMAVVFQEPLLLHTSVYENVALGLRLRGAARATIAGRVSKWLGHFGVKHRRRATLRPFRAARRSVSVSPARSPWSLAFSSWTNRSARWMSSRVQPSFPPFARPSESPG
jgi:tungstate transport system ATP-binding protein